MCNWTQHGRLSLDCAEESHQCCPVESTGKTHIFPRCSAIIGIPSFPKIPRPIVLSISLTKKLHSPLLIISPTSTLHSVDRLLTPSGPFLSSSMRAWSVAITNCSSSSLPAAVPSSFFPALNIAKCLDGYVVTISLFYVSTFSPEFHATNIPKLSQCVETLRNNIVPNEPFCTIPCECDVDNPGVDNVNLKFSKVS